MVTAGVNLDQLQKQLQGNILRAYGIEYRHVRHLVLAIADPIAARAALLSMITGDRATPEITPAGVRPRTADLDWCLNVGMTFEGLRALGLPQESLASFPREFRDGIVARAARLGDVGSSAPERWIGGLHDAERVHLVVTVHGREHKDLEEVSGQVLAAQGGRAFELLSIPPLDGEALEGPMPWRQSEEEREREESTDADVRTARFVHFGYLDGISQPRFEGIHDVSRRASVARLPWAPLGSVLLGHPTALPHVMWRIPHPAHPLGLNGTYSAFRVLRQDVSGFEAFLDETAAGLECDKELVAAKLCGRWRNGAPLTLAPDERASKDLHPDRYNDFDYEPDDADGSRCPIGSHIRRCNPRGAHIVQRASNRTRPIVRRGMPYGPRFDPANPDDKPRGLLGNFLCASLAAQFEAMQYDWINLGLLHPSISGTHDPLVGPNEDSGGRFVWPRKGEDPIVLTALARFVTTEGAAYLYLPTIPAMQWIGSAGWS